MKKIIVVSHAMRLGGVETSLIGLLQSIDYSRYDVDLFLYVHDGEYIELIPKEVNLLPQINSYASLLLPFQKNTLPFKLTKLLAKAYSYLYRTLNKIVGDNFVYLINLHRFSHFILPKINKQSYDLGISFLTPHYTVAQKINAINKIAWIHTDYSEIALDKAAEIRMWKTFDHIASIGEDSALAFIDEFPELEERVMVIENILPKAFVMQRSLEFDVKFDSEAVNLCSIGRFTYPKNFDNIPEITRYLLDNKINVKWYIIGYGGDEDLIKSKIKEYRVEDSVIILGKKSNPYPYIKACDIYIQPSRYEGKAVTVREAQILAKPVVITNYSSSSSQLINGVDGIIVPLETFECAMGIAELIQDQNLIKLLIKNCQDRNYSNENEIKKIYNIIENSEY